MPRAMTPATNRPAVPLSQALDEASPLVSLRERLQASAECLAIIRPLLPEALRAGVRAGPIDERGWCLLVPHQPAAAKIRQLLPALEAALAGNSQSAKSIRIRVQQAIAEPSLPAPDLRGKPRRFQALEDSDGQMPSTAKVIRAGR